MKLIVGLGNPGKQYEKTRHNIGFMVIDAYVNYHKGQWVSKSKFKAEVCQIDDVIFIKPQTFMNLSGESVQTVKNFYKIETRDILVISDDIDLEFGTVRVRQDGGDGGHNGLKSIIEHIGSDFWRLRIGVANELRQKIEASDFVLNNFSANELEQINANLNKLTDLITGFIQNKPEAKSFMLQGRNQDPGN